MSLRFHADAAVAAVAATASAAVYDIATGKALENHRTNYWSIIGKPLENHWERIGNPLRNERKPIRKLREVAGKAFGNQGEWVGKPKRKPTATFWRDPGYILRRFLYIACFAMNAVLGIDNKFFFLNFVYTYRTISL